MGFGCSVPAIMATRTLESEKDHILSVLINPFMSCSARLPIYILLAGTFHGKSGKCHIFNIPVRYCDHYTRGPNHSIHSPQGGYSSICDGTPSIQDAHVQQPDDSYVG
jgi:hypothetical protein